MQSNDEGVTIDYNHHCFTVAPDMVIAIKFLSPSGRSPTVQDIKHAIIQIDMMRAMMAGESLDVACSVSSLEVTAADSEKETAGPSVPALTDRRDGADQGFLTRITNRRREKAPSNKPANQVQNAETAQQQQ